MPHPNQTLVVSSRRFVPTGCDPHPTFNFNASCSAIQYKWPASYIQLQCILFCHTIQMTRILHSTSMYYVLPYNKKWPESYIQLQCILFCHTIQVLLKFFIWIRCKTSLTLSCDTSRCIWGLSSPVLKMVGNQNSKFKGIFEGVATHPTTHPFQLLKNLA